MEGTGPVITATESANSVTFQVLQERLTYTGGSTNARFSARGDDRLEVPVQRTNLDGWLRLDYRIGRRWALTADYTRELTQPYRGSSLRTDSDRISLGLVVRY